MKASKTGFDAPANRSSARRIPAEAGIWLFIFGDILVFTLYFFVFGFERVHDLQTYRRSQAELNVALGLFNTLLLLTSSWLVASAMLLIREGGAPRIAALKLLLAIGCGLGFVGVKVVEYAEKVTAGITLTSNDFFTFYYMFTGIHLMHVLIGLGVLICMAWYAYTNPDSARKLVHFESGASFWHMVDLLWIVLFALLYLLP